jgi:UDP-N-acetylmuramoyl-tripeptide--D-alanyl-D-alanine ligase
MNASSPLWTASEAAQATGGKKSGDWAAHGISIDTRSLQPGDLFVALTGDARDGHDFVAQALEKGAAAALVANRPADVAPGAPLLMVDDTLAGLQALGVAARSRTQARIAAVTGSAGKTTTKEMLHLMLGRGHAVAASAASYNNHWGVPLSLARMARDTEFGVFEIGMNHAGEIRALVKDVRPHVALVTTVAPAHLEYFSGVEAIADAKAEIFEGVEKGGTVILPADNPHYERLRARAEALGIRHILSFGATHSAHARLISSEARANGQALVADIDGARIAFTIGAQGAHIAANALAALLAARGLGLTLADAAAGLADFTALKGRGASFVAGGIEIIDESYNANPASMAAALDLLAKSTPAPSGKRIAVLGDMLELGEESIALHRALAAPIAAAGVNRVFLCGPLMAALWAALPAAQRGAHAETSAGLAHELMGAVSGGDVVLVKGSFGSRMSVIIDAFRARANAAA